MTLLAPDTGPRLLRSLRWTGRAASLASLGLLALFATEESAAPSASEWLLLALFPIGVAIGTILAWWREILGGAVALASLVAFHASLAILGDRPWPGPWFVVFTAPAIALLACGLWARARTHTPSAAADSLRR
ncbi:MAG: hypothetical protein RIS86_2286 [Planctomycetota bacterium]|jgi:hypothetical protein